MSSSRAYGQNGWLLSFPLQAHCPTHAQGSEHLGHWLRHVHAVPNRVENAVALQTGSFVSLKMLSAPPIDASAAKPSRSVTDVAPMMRRLPPTDVSAPTPEKLGSDGTSSITRSPPTF